MFRGGPKSLNFAIGLQSMCHNKLTVNRGEVVVVVVACPSRPVAIGGFTIKNPMMG